MQTKSEDTKVILAADVQPGTMLLWSDRLWLVLSNERRGGEYYEKTRYITFLVDGLEYPGAKQIQCIPYSDTNELEVLAW